MSQCQKMEQNHGSEELVQDDDDDIYIFTECSQWVDEVTAVYQKLSDAQRNDLLQKLMNVSSFAQLYYLQDNLQKIQHRDFMIFLPKEMTEYILSFLDVKSLCRCCQVSKNWNSVILSCVNTWKHQCIKLGLHLSDKTMHAIDNNSETYREICFRMAKKMQWMKISEGFENSIYEGHSKRVTAVYYWNEKLATGTSNGELILWNTQTDQLLYKTFIPNFCITCICFNNDVLVTTSAAGYLWTLDMITMKPMRRYGGVPGAIFALDFSSSLNIVVSGSADSLVRLWSLTTGQIIDILHGHSHWIARVILRNLELLQRPIQFEDADAMLVTVDKERILVWLITVDDNACKRHVISVILLNGHFTPGIHFDEWQLCYIDQGSYGTSRTKLCKYDVLTSSVICKVEIPSNVKVLLGIGKKYICLLTHCEYRSFVILDVRDWKEVASWPIPASRTIAPGHPHIGFNATEWLDGFDGFNDIGLVVSVGLEDGTVLTVRWRK